MSRFSTLTVLSSSDHDTLSHILEFALLICGVKNVCRFSITRYERGWPSYFTIVRRGKDVGVREAQICVWKLAANASDCGWCILVAFPL